VLLAFYGSKDAAPQLEAIKAASTIVLGAGGAVALILAARRQRSAELTLQQAERIASENAADRARDLAQRDKAAADVRLDATERRITDLYTKAADQLGSEKAAVRLAGIYAMERLASDHPEHRQTIVNVLCAYLRMPYRPLPDDADPQIIDANKQEGEVRYAAQEVLTDGLSIDAEGSVWEVMSVNLTGAYLNRFSIHLAASLSLVLSGASVGELRMFSCDCDDLDLSQTTVRGAFSIEDGYLDSWDFSGAEFQGGARFDSVKFHRDTGVNSVSAVGPVQFTRCEFEDRVWFSGGKYEGALRFEKCNGPILRMDSVILNGGFHFEGNEFGGIKFDDGTRVKKGTVWAGHLPDGINLHDYDEEYQSLGARIGNYNIKEPGVENGDE
jgi:hypothetical protein